MAAAEPSKDYLTQKDNTQLHNLPGNFGLPLLGKTFSFVTKPYAMLDELYKKHGPVSKASLTFQKLVVALGPEYIKELTLDSDRVFSSKMGYRGPVGEFFEGGLLTRDFSDHKFHRRIMQTAFKTTAMRGYVDEMNPIIDSAIAKWQTDKDFHFYPHVKTLLLDIGAKIFLGLDLEGRETKELNEAFLDMIAGSLAVIRKDWPGLTYRKGMNGRRFLEKFFVELVPKKRGQQGKDMATYFANETTEDGDLYDDKIVADHLIFLLLAAHDTTTSAITMACSLLAHNQDWQDRLRAEVTALGKDHIEFDDLAKLTDFDNTFKEVMRLHPPVPMMMRRTVRDIELGGYNIPAHTIIQISPLYVHRMDEYWTNPHDFDPDRFARNEHKKHAFQWAPFGGGAHKCIGLHFADMLFKCVLANMLQKNRISFGPDNEYPSKLQYFPFAKPIDNLPLIIEPIA
jgi:cytochrome P450|tara:strand:- start:250 stop:1614 length:1365 start_codon:yes stop_codon:yes gene_type:complete